MTKAQQPKFKPNTPVICNLRGTFKMGTIVGRKKKEGSDYYTVRLDGGAEYDDMSCDPSYPCHVDIEKTLKLKNKSLKQYEA